MTFRRIGCPVLVTMALFGSILLGHDPVRIEAPTPDGVKIIGDYWTPIRSAEGAPVVILLHMYRSDRTAWGRDMIIALEMAGFAIARIDLRGHGESTGTAEQRLSSRVHDRDEELFNAMDQDVAAVVDWLGTRPEADTSRIALIGASVGCSVALDFARGQDSVRAAALLSPGVRYLGVDSVAHVREYGARPLLMLTSREEQPRGFDELAASAKAARVQIETRVFEEQGIHGTKMLGKVEGVEELIASFLREHVN